ncbi:FAS1-like dehydratase domain-containing protein [Thermomonospora cellulosilytica]|uniref:3-methylfumaryl-CoA hydratase n=1 Tax=Thermomonospora cellulosilytica TaxID=1411118 RepID=A0A7W3R6J5_9ACTN|nr:MaoC family dehydratase N-terminal domain-containing protein [Thermomonospora cellulosilytica]MBA9001682.1 3-methylfumaryl-CoA hydratase [Thermomonospora cellulosilytica]
MTGGLAEHVKGWSPGPVAMTEAMPPGPAQALAAVLDRPQDAPAAGDPLPPLWHWVYFLEWPAQSELGDDGHPANGHFLPPIPDRTRMYAGGRLTFHAPLEVGTPAERTSELAGVNVKQGRSGEMLFVTVRHEIRQGGELRIVDEHDLVYRSGAAPVRHEPDTGPAAETEGPWRLVPAADSRVLFRFSALTANAHRIHYDEPYAREVEGYPGLVVHGPLLAILMAELPRRNAPGTRVGRLAYRFRRPVFLGENVVVTGGPDGALSVVGPSGEVRAQAEVAFA